MEKNINQSKNNESSNMAKLKASLDFSMQVIKAINENNIESIQCMLNPLNYTNLTIEYKEELIFKNVCRFFQFNNLSKKILYYLIFDYQISEENALNNTETESYGFKANDEVRKMFEIRKLNQELNLNLKINEDNQTTTIKI
jgi:hypothetical protein